MGKLDITLGSFLRDVRMEKEISLHEMCKRTGFDSTTYTQIELGEICPLGEDDFLKKAANAFCFDAGSREYLELEKLTIESEKIIVDPKERSLMSMLPAFFRNANGGKPTREDLLRILKLLKGS